MYFGDFWQLHASQHRPGIGRGFGFSKAVEEGKREKKGKKEKKGGKEGKREKKKENVGDQ